MDETERALREEHDQLAAQLAAVGAERAALVHERSQLLEQLASVGKEAVDLLRLYEACAREIGTSETNLQSQLREQLASVGKEAADLRRLYEASAHEKGLAEIDRRLWRYMSTRYLWQMQALQRELFGAPAVSFRMNSILRPAALSPCCFT